MLVPGWYFGGLLPTLRVLVIPTVACAVPVLRIVTDVATDLCSCKSVTDGAVEP